MTNTKKFTSGSVEVETLESTIELGLYSLPGEDEAWPTERAAVLELGENEALEVGLLLIRAHHNMKDARLARGERLVPTLAELADAATILSRG